MATETQVVTGKGRLSYAHIWEPHSSGEDKEKKYSTAFLWPKSDTKTTEAIKKAVEAAIAAGPPKWGGKRPIPSKLKLPIRDGDEEKPGDPAYAGMWFFNASSKDAPGIVQLVNKVVTAITDKTKVYSGCYCMISVNFYPFAASGNNGVGAGLNNILFVKDGEPLSGGTSAADDFAGVEIEEDGDDDMM